jgi:peptidoglycan/LPS O-acetylase OafA/YrhL
LKSRIRELDGLRAIAVLMVVTWHYIGLPAGGDSVSGGGSFLYYLCRPGRSGVDLFLVLSGFLITSILIENRNSDNYYRIFYTRRALRILPVYAIMIFVLLLGRLYSWNPNVFGGEFPIWSYPLFLQNVAMARIDNYGPSFMSATWSLAVEEQFYLLFPLLLAMTPQRLLPKLLLGMLLIAPVLRASSFWNSQSYMGAYVLTSHRADALAIGALIAWAFSTGTVKTTLAANSRFVLRGFAVLVAAAPVLYLTPGADFPRNLAYWGHTYLTLLYGTALLTVLLYEGSRWLWVLRSPLAAGLAAISYALYLVHDPLLHLIEPAGLPRVVLLPVAFAASIALCTASYFIIERPCLRLGRRMRYSTPQERDGTLSPSASAVAR